VVAAVRQEEDADRGGRRRVLLGHRPPEESGPGAALRSTTDLRVEIAQEDPSVWLRHEGPLETLGIVVDRPDLDGLSAVAHAARQREEHSELLLPKGLRAAAAIDGDDVTGHRKVTGAAADEEQRGDDEETRTYHETISGEPPSERSASRAPDGGSL